MVLTLSGEQGNRTASEVEKSFFPNLLLRNLTMDKSNPCVLNATIKDNEINMNVNYMPFVNGKSFPNASFIDFTFSGKRSSNPELKFSLDPKKTYNFEFEAGDNFNEVAARIFRRNPPNLVEKTANMVGINLPDKIDISVNYETPLAFWRNLPKEFLSSVSAFNFRGDFYEIRWPSGNTILFRESKEGNPKELDPRVLNAVKNEKIEEEFERLKKMLINTGFVGYSLKQNKRYPKEEHHFNINPEDINYTSLQVLEEIIRETPEGLMKEFSFAEPESKILIKGKFDRDIFTKVDKSFNSYMGHGNSYAKAGNITVSYYPYAGCKEPKVNVHLENSTLEEAERIMGIGVSREKVRIRYRDSQNMYKTELLMHPEIKS